MRNNLLQSRRLVIGAGLASLLLAACGPTAKDQEAQTPSSAAQAPVEASRDATPGTAAPPAAETREPPASETRDTASEPTEAPEEVSAEAAETTLRRYYGAINAKDYAAAYALWSNQGAASQQSYEAFAHGYGKTLMVDARVGKASDAEGAAGSRYIKVPVELAAAQTDGRTRHYRGSFTLRAVMADGATPEQRRWHLDSADLEGYEPRASDDKPPG